jgi:diguanylate cyclase (GGDEF)-like protein
VSAPLDWRSNAGRVIGISAAMLSVLAPSHMWIGPGGFVSNAGPTLTRMMELGTNGETATGRRAFDLVEILAPRRAESLESLLLLHGHRLKLRLTNAPDLALSGLVLPLPAGSGALLNLTPGAGLIEAVRRFDLRLSDFAPTELAGELLFLTEAIAANYAETKSLYAALRAAHSRAEAEATTDTLTGLANRRAMDRALAELAAGADGAGFGVMQIDLDHFKAVNDRFGHAAGDAVLLAVSDILRSETRRGDLVVRTGGDEFVVVFPGCDDLDLLDKIAKRIIARLEDPIHVQGQACRVSASIGTTVSSHYAHPQPDQLLGDADIATYRSKSAGRGQHTLFTPAAAPERSARALQNEADRPVSGLG